MKVNQFAVLLCCSPLGVDVDGVLSSGGGGGGAATQSGEDIVGEVETPIKAANAGTVERHRLAFNMKVFPALFEGGQMKELKDHPPTNNTFDMSQQEWEESYPKSVAKCSTNLLIHRRGQG